MEWKEIDDTINLHPQKLTLERSEFTKRKVLSLFSKTFDPIGIVTPIIIRSRMLIQKLWKGKFDWDDLINDDNLYKEATSILEDMSKVGELTFDRKLSLSKKVILHAFSDASGDGFGCVVYAKSTNREPQFLVSKARVTPLKEDGVKLSIPKLELTAASLSTRLVKFVKETFKDELIIEDVYYWTDSKVVLSWIKNQKELPKFESTLLKVV